MNVTPDKRQVLIPNEDLLIFMIKTSLTTLYEKLQGVYKIGEASSASLVVSKLSAPAQTSSTVSARAASAAAPPDNTLKRHNETALPSRPEQALIDSGDPPAPKQFKSARNVLDGGTTPGSGAGVKTIGKSLAEATISSASTSLAHEGAFGQKEKATVSSRIDGQRRPSDASNGSGGNGQYEMVVFHRRRDFDADLPPRQTSSIERPRSNSSAGSAPLADRAYKPKTNTLDSWIKSKRQRISSGSSNASNQSSFALHRPSHRLVLSDKESEDGRRRSRLDDFDSGDDIDEIRSFRPPSRTRSNSKEDGKPKPKPKAELPVEVNKDATISFPFMYFLV